MKECFIPLNRCTEMSGDCFRLGACLNDCTPPADRKSAEARFKEIEQRLARIEARFR